MGPRDVATTHSYRVYVVMPHRGPCVLRLHGQNFVSRYPGCAVAWGRGCHVVGGQGAGVGRWITATTRVCINSRGVYRSNQGWDFNLLAVLLDRACDCAQTMLSQVVTPACGCEVWVCVCVCGWWSRCCLVRRFVFLVFPSPFGLASAAASECSVVWGGSWGGSVRCDFKVELGTIFGGVFELLAIRRLMVLYSAG